MQKVFTTTLLIFSHLLLLCSCAEKLENKEVDFSVNDTVESFEETGRSLENKLVCSGVKVPIINNGRMLGYSYKEEQYPFLASIESFLNWYTDDELLGVTKLAISNRDTGSGKRVPLVSTKGIERLPNLKYLIIATSGVERLDGLDQLLMLEQLELPGNNLEEIKNIGSLAHLRSLNLIGNPINSLLNIEGSIFLESLSVDRTKVTTFNGVERFPNLISIGANENKLADITAIADLAKLQALEMLSFENELNPESIELLEKLAVENPEMYLEWKVKKGND